MLPRRVHRRSVAFLEADDVTWACFLVTYEDDDRGWRGYFSFRPSQGGVEEDQIRTADILVEPTEEEVRRKARGLGRPLLSNLLASALHTHQDRGDAACHLRGWFRTFLSENSRRLLDDADPPGEQEGPPPFDLRELRSLYASYRLDQVAHFIALVPADDFPDAVERILDGRSVDFRTRDRLQFAMMVVDYIEERLPLPPFDVWARDYLAHRESYRLYAHTLHRHGRLP